MSDVSVPVVSVIVPVYNDSARLPACLEALERQQAGTPAFELLVVDNGSDPSCDIPGIVARFPRARYLHEASAGSYAARNCGIRAARGRIVAFTDSDCVPAPDWIAQGVRHLTSDAGIGLVAGRIDLTFKTPDRRNAVELYEVAMAFPQEHWVTVEHYGATANVFTTMAVLDAVGPFDDQLKSGGDAEWGRRVLAAGYRQVYAAEVLVLHPARTTFAAIYQRTVRHAGGHYMLRCLRSPSFTARQWAFVKELVADLMPPVRFAWNLRKDPRYRGLRQVMTVAAVLAVVRYVSAWEKIRLKLGATTARE